MKKVLCLITGLILSASILAGCSSNKTSDNQNPARQNTTQGGRGNFGGGNNQNNGMPRLSGEVASIDGNKITLKVIQTPNRGMGNGGAQQRGQSGNQAATGKGQTNGQGTARDGQAPPADSQGNGQSSNGTSQGGQTNGQQQNGQRQNRQPGSGFNMQVQYTGETKTITIPDGVSITTFNRNAQSGGAENISIKDIKVGDRLTVSYSDANETTISGITVMNFNKNQGQTQNQNQSQSQSQNQNSQ